STGLLHGGYPDRFPVQAVAMVPGAGPSAPQEVLVTVVPGPAARVELTPRPAKLVVGQQVPLSASVFSAAGDRRSDPVRWTSSAPRVAEVGADGRLTARAAGSAVISASASGGRAEATLAITVAPNSIRRLDIEGAGTGLRTGA